MSNLYTFMGGIRLHYDERERVALKRSITVMPAPSQNLLIVMTLEHFVLPLIKS